MSHFWLLLNQSTYLLQLFCGCFLHGPLPCLLKSGCYPFFLLEDHWPEIIHIYLVRLIPDLYSLKEWFLFNPFLTIFKQIQRFVANLVLMFLGWTPTRCLKSGCYPFFNGIMGNYVEFFQILRSLSLKPLTRNDSYIMVNFFLIETILLLQIRVWYILVLFQHQRVCSTR